MRVILCDDRGWTVGVYDAPALADALDRHAQALGYADDTARWAAEGPLQGRALLMTVGARTTEVQL